MTSEYLSLHKESIHNSFYNTPLSFANMKLNHLPIWQNDSYHYADDTSQDSNSILSNSAPSNSCDDQTKVKKVVLKKLASKSDSSIYTLSTYSDCHNNKPKKTAYDIVEDLLPNEKPNTMSTKIHIVEYKENGANHIILESRSSPTNFLISNIDKVRHPKLLAPAKPVIQEIGKNKKSSAPRMDWNNYHRLATIHSFLDELESDYPSICTTGSIGKSLEGRELKILKISNTNTSNKCIWIDAGIHAREWIAPAVATYIANHIAANFNILPESITNKDWFFLPVVNPDGYEHSHTVERMWRKNMAWHKGQCVGVDLNRNFSFGWGGKGSSEVPTNAFYRGPEAFSEPESTAMRDILVNSGISFQVYITLHSYGQVIIFPFAFKDELCPDYVKLLEGATIMSKECHLNPCLGVLCLDPYYLTDKSSFSVISKAIYEASGNIYKVGISRDVMYGAAGTSYDFSYGEAGIPFCYLIELRSKKHKFMLPKAEIEETGNEILNCVKALMEFIDNCPVKLES